MRKSLLILAFPLVEYAVFRFFVREFLGISLGWSGFTDMDFLLPVPISIALAVHLLAEKKKLKLQLQVPWALVNLAAMLALAFLSVYFESLSAKWGATLLVSVWVASALAMLASSLLLWVKYSFYFRSDRSWVILPCLGLAFSSVTALAIYSVVWDTLGPFLGRLVCGYGNLIYRSEISCEFQSTSRLFIAHPLYGISIAQGCSGVDGLTVFLYCLCTYALLRGKALSANHWMLCFFAGCVGMILLNLVRILSLFSFGIWLEGISPGASRWPVSFLFHANLGWALYLAGILLLFRTMDRFRKTESESLLDVPARMLSTVP